MFRRYICLIYVVCMVGSMGTPSKAMERTFRIIPQWCGNSVADGTVIMSRIGQESEGEFYITDGLANWTVTEEEIISQFFEITPQKGLFQEQSCAVTEDGALFRSPENGIYLISQEEPADGFYPFAPILLHIDDRTENEVILKPKLISASPSPYTGEHPAPILGAMGLGLAAAILIVLADDRKK